jgi:hypothetical protein
MRTRLTLAAVAGIMSAGTAMAAPISIALPHGKDAIKVVQRGPYYQPYYTQPAPTCGFWGKGCAQQPRHHRGR